MVAVQVTTLVPRGKVLRWAAHSFQCAVATVGFGTSLPGGARDIRGEICRTVMLGKEQGLCRHGQCRGVPD